MRHSEKLFLHIADTNTFVTEISDLPRPAMGPIFDDAADLGLTMITPSGEHIKFYVDSEDVDRDGDITAWNLLPVPASVRTMTKYKDAKITIFND